MLGGVVLEIWTPGSMFLSVRKGRWTPDQNGFPGCFHRLSPLSLPLLSCPEWATLGQADRSNV